MKLRRTDVAFDANHSELKMDEPKRPFMHHEVTPPQHFRCLVHSMGRRRVSHNNHLCGASKVSLVLFFHHMISNPPTLQDWKFRRRGPSCVVYFVHTRSFFHHIELLLGFCQYEYNQKSAGGASAARACDGPSSWSAFELRQPEQSASGGSYSGGVLPNLIDACRWHADVDQDSSAREALFGRL